jgi:hypothetical protein
MKPSTYRRRTAPAGLVMALMTDPRIAAMKPTREFMAGSAFGIPEDAYDNFLSGLLAAADAVDPVRVLLADTDKLTDLFLESGWNATRTARDSTWADADEWPREVWIALKAQQIEAHIVALRAAVDGEQS